MRVRGTFAGSVEPFGGGSRARSQNPVWSFGEPLGVRLPSANPLCFRETSAYPMGRTHRKVYKYYSPLRLQYVQRARHS